MHSRTGMALPQPVMKTQQREIPIVINMRLILMDPVMKQDFSPPVDTYP